MKFCEEYRHDHPIIGMGSKYFAAFRIPHPEMKGYAFNVLATDGEEWEHVCVTISLLGTRPNFCPTWEDMSYIKDLFFCEDQCAVQYHPSKSEYVNNHPHALHLFARKQNDFPIPPSEMIGAK